MSSSSKYLTFNQTNDSFFAQMKNVGGRINRSTVIIISAILFFAVISYLYYIYYVVPQMNAKYHPNSEQVPAGTGGNEAELLFFFADWCPHCKTAKPIWSDLKAEYQNKVINGYQIIFTEINCSEETAEVEKMMNQYSVEGYPTIKLLKDGQIIEYDAKPSKETLTQFLNTVL